MAADVPEIDGGHESPVHRRAHRGAVSRHRAGRAPLRGPRPVHCRSRLPRTTPSTAPGFHGAPVDDWRGLDLAAQPTRLLVNGEERLTGSGGQRLSATRSRSWRGWPTNCRDMGSPSSRGDFVTTGVTTDVIYPAEAGERLTADFPGNRPRRAGFRVTPRVLLPTVWTSFILALSACSESTSSPTAPSPATTTPSRPTRQLPGGRWIGRGARPPRPRRAVKRTCSASRTILSGEVLVPTARTYVSTNWHTQS